MLGLFLEVVELLVDVVESPLDAVELPANSPLLVTNSAAAVQLVLRLLVEPGVAAQRVPGAPAGGGVAGTIAGDVVCCWVAAI